MIKFIRGDTFAFKFKRKYEDGSIIETVSQKMWFTVKKNYTTTKIEIQKTLNNGITYTPEDNYYHIILNSSDTKGMKYAEYVCDIQVENDGIVKTIYKDTLELDTEVTFEGGEE